MSTPIHEKAAIGFDKASDAYERGRPDYPQEAIDFLIRTLKIQSSSTVLDLGAGTGKFTRLLKSSEARIIAIEPVDGMRTKFESILPDIEIHKGTAESIPVKDASIDVVTSAQAFHWFDGPTTLKEIHRILVSGGKLALIWNVRDESVEWMAGISKIMEPYEGKTPRYKSMNWKKTFDETKYFTKLQLQQFPYVQVGTADTVVDRFGSVSFIAALPETERHQVLQQMRDLLRKHPQTQSPKIPMPYITNVYWCEKI